MPGNFVMKMHLNSNSNKQIIRKPPPPPPPSQSQLPPPQLPPPPPIKNNLNVRNNINMPMMNAIYSSGKGCGCGGGR